MSTYQSCWVCYNGKNEERGDVAVKIEDLIKQAKDTMLTDGNVMPMIMLELDKDFIIMALDTTLSDTQSIPAQCGILARLGWEECKKYPGQQIVSVGYYAEAWSVVAPKETEHQFRPVKSKDRREIIAVEMYQTQEKPRVQSYFLPVIRDHKQRVIDVGPAEGPHPQISHQLISFILGTQDARKPDEEVFATLHKRLNHRLDNLSPEKHKELIRLLEEEGILDE